MKSDIDTRSEGLALLSFVRLRRDESFFPAEKVLHPVRIKELPPTRRRGWCCVRFQKFAHVPDGPAMIFYLFAGAAVGWYAKGKLRMCASCAVNNTHMSV